MMLFGEKYPDPVRMVSMGSFSKELCGGTHATNTGEIQTLEILAEESVSSGTRRITALTGSKAVEHRGKIESLAKQTAAMLGCSLEQLGICNTRVVDNGSQTKEDGHRSRQRSVARDGRWHQSRLRAQPRTQPSVPPLGKRPVN
jgi:alanyl-tRNA synthetase